MFGESVNGYINSSIPTTNNSEKKNEIRKFLQYEFEYATLGVGFGIF